MLLLYAEDVEAHLNDAKSRSQCPLKVCHSFLLVAFQSGCATAWLRLECIGLEGSTIVVGSSSNPLLENLRVGYFLVIRGSSSSCIRSQWSMGKV